MPMLSVLMPARNEKFLQKTIENVLENATGEIEIIAICDGYWPEPPIKDDPRVVIIHHTNPRGQRASMNEAARIAKGDYVMKLDAHCAVAKGFDTQLIADAKELGDDVTQIPRMWNLNTETWRPRCNGNFDEGIKRAKVCDYMHIGFNDKGELRSLYYTGSEYRKIHKEREHILIDDIMDCMGPCFFMSKKRYWELDGADEEHGGIAGWGQQGIEVSCKSWLSGGRMVVNKKTWFAHWFRGNEGFPYKINESDIQKAREYSKSLWLENKWHKQTRKFQFLIDKFNPPSWRAEKNNVEINKEDEIQAFFYRQVHLKKNDPSWRGIRMIKMPTDIVLYQEAIWDKKPDFIVEIGTAMCGSALMMADFLEMTGKGKVISIDPSPRGPYIEHPRIIYLKGDSKSDDIINQIKEIVGDGSVMVSIDGDHRRQQVKWELKKYSNIVTEGQYMVVEDCYGRRGELVGPGQARDWFLSWNKKFKLTNFGKGWIFGMTKDSWLLKR